MNYSLFTVDELTPMYDSRKSFYGKARVTHYADGSKTLTSYSTNVARIEADGTLKVRGTYSATTLRHVKEFMRQHGFNADTISDVRKYIN